jgi:hypothetical protein
MLVFVLPAFFFTWLPDGEARPAPRPRPRPRPEAPKVNQQAAKAIPALVGNYKFGSNKDQIINLLTTGLRKEYTEQIRKAGNDPMRQDRLRRDLEDEIRKVRKSYIAFDGKRTNWDSSLVDDQFGHNNGESMLVYLEKEQQRFFYFHHGRLYKQFIAFNADHPNYKGLTFPAFLGKLIQAFGQGNAVFQKDVSGNSRLHHVEWIGANNIYMWAVDKSTVYGNFCVVLFDNTMKEKVDQGRKASGEGPRRTSDDDLIDSISKPPSEQDMQADPDKDMP